MAYRSPLLVLLPGAWLALCLIAGCNAVLGIEEATLKDHPDGGGADVVVVAPGKFYTGGNICAADVAPACTSCLASAKGDSLATCAGDLAQCMSTRSCRKQFDQYSTCLQKGCRADPGNCFEPLFAPTKGTPSCVTEHCYRDCSSSQVASPCQLYCACMGANCSSKFPSMNDCLAACSLLDADMVTCRRTHCEIAADDPNFGHCDHAVGITNCVAKPNRAQECTDKSLLTFACTADSDCCSGNCNTTLKACAPP